jgi:transcription-repair coupling factor (superfamily II helicase)
VEAITIIGLIQSNPKKFKMNGATGLKMLDDKALATAEGRIDAVKNLLEQLGVKE